MECIPLNLTGAAVDDPKSSETWVGVILSVIGDALIAVSLNLQKYTHTKIAKHEEKTGVKQHWLKKPLWWIGIIMNLSGEGGNLLAYNFAPASVVAPVGAVGVLVNAIIVVVFLKEKLRPRDIVAQILIICGVVLVVVFSPESNDTLTVQHFMQKISHPMSWGYLIGLAVMIGLFLVLAYKFGKRHVLFYVTLCSLISSITVISAKAFSSFLGTSIFTMTGENGTVIEPNNQFWTYVNCTDCANTSGLVLDPVATAVPWLCAIAIVITGVWSVMYLNSAMQHFGNSQVVPVYYSTFTTFSIAGAAVVYQELVGMKALCMGMFFVGVACIIAGVYLVTSKRKAADYDKMGSTVGSEKGDDEGEEEKDADDVLRDEKDIELASVDRGEEEEEEEEEGEGAEREKKRMQAARVAGRRRSTLLTIFAGHKSEVSLFDAEGQRRKKRSGTTVSELSSRSSSVSGIVVKRRMTLTGQRMLF